MARDGLAILEVGRGRSSTRVRFSKGTESLFEFGRTLWERSHSLHRLFRRVLHRNWMTAAVGLLVLLFARLINSVWLGHSTQPPDCRELYSPAYFIAPL